MRRARRSPGAAAAPTRRSSTATPGSSSTSPTTSAVAGALARAARRPGARAGAWARPAATRAGDELAYDVLAGAPPRDAAGLRSDVGRDGRRDAGRGPGADARTVGRRDGASFSVVAVALGASRSTGPEVSVGRRRVAGAVRRRLRRLPAGPSRSRSTAAAPTPSASAASSSCRTARPGRCRCALLGALAVQVVVAVATAAVHPFTSQAFGVLVPMFGLGLAGLWGARYGTLRAARADRSDRPVRTDPRLNRTECADPWPIPSPSTPRSTRPRGRRASTSCSTSSATRSGPRDLKEATVARARRRGAGRSRCAFRAAGMGHSTSYTLRYDYAGARRARVAARAGRPHAQARRQLPVRGPRRRRRST